MKISWEIRTLELAYEFRISKGAYASRDALIICLEQDGLKGYGEATEISYYNVRLGRLIDLIQDNLRRLSSIPLRTPEEYVRLIQPILNRAPFLLSAFDCAAHDLFGKLHGHRTIDRWRLDVSAALPHTTYTIGLDTLENMQQKIHDLPWPIYKIKLDGIDDLKLLRGLREVTQSPFLIDANEAWQPDDLKTLLPELLELKIIAVEQPIHRSQEYLLAPFKGNNAMPLIADESCQGLADVEKCAGLFDGINIKLMKCGGLTIAKKMIEKARELHLKVMIGCMTESTIGISAAAQLIPLVDFVDLDGAMLIKNDLATGINFIDGQVQYTSQPGLGFQLN